MIAVPARQLGDQQRNAEVFAAADAVIVLQDDELGRDGVLADTVRTLLDSPEQAGRLADALHTFAKPDAAARLAALVIQAAKS